MRSIHLLQMTPTNDKSQYDSKTNDRPLIEILKPSHFFPKIDNTVYVTVNVHGSQLSRTIVTYSTGQQHMKKDWDMYMTLMHADKV